MTTAHSGASGSEPEAASAIPCRSLEIAACLDELLASGEPRTGYDTLLHRAADVGLYDVVRAWSLSDTPATVDKMTARLLLPAEMLAALTQETAWSDDEALTALTTELPLAVRRYSTKQRFNRFGHTGCHGEDPVRR
ncbi:MAG: hypothetical protein ABF479_13330 [Gluconacetobacter sp.]|uniref:Uncharacterized protein n=1 Tax=Gluconacetobacter dulcium TaxID=2729096 RepID=A0A7W4JWP2_9PROT|nr:hypothetical protein [Gluconacetobacter dulcium]MBB2196079.1 hypothetical protein [Gluconacetobacter dulcium]